jgi:hypothetical protein
MQAKGRASILKLNYRNACEILYSSCEVVKIYFTENADNEMPLIKLEATGLNGKQEI